MSDYKAADTSLSIALQAHMGLGIVMMGGFSYVFARSYYSTKKEQSKLFKALPLSASFLKMFYYILSLILYTTQDPALVYLDPIFLRFFTWFVTIPPILIAISLLESLDMTDIVCLSTMNCVMIISGYFAHVASHNATIWSFYSFGGGCAYFIGRNMYLKYDRIRHKKIQSITNKIYQFLCVYTAIVWNIFPISFIFYKTGMISYEIQNILYVYLDIFAKGFLGIILMGARDIMDKKEGRMVRFTNAIIHVYTREKSITEEEVVTDTTDDGSLTPPPSLEELTPAEKDFITGKTPNKPHTIIPVNDAPLPKPTRSPQTKIVRSHSSPQLNRGRA
jgi:bacteriorhodopsin